MATQLLLDVWNIFISLLRIFSSKDWSNKSKLDIFLSFHI
jgi:hypothetical protein